jgi:hypothetical protein
MTLQSLNRTPELDNPGPQLIDDRHTRPDFGSTARASCTISHTAPVIDASPAAI